MSPLVRAAVLVVTEILPELVDWAIGLLADGKDPEAELRALMAGAEAAARAAEREKFGE